MAVKRLLAALWVPALLVLLSGCAAAGTLLRAAWDGIQSGGIEGVGFQAADYDEMVKRYDPQKLSYGYNTLPDGEEIYFIPNPALGLWINREKF